MLTHVLSPYMASITDLKKNPMHVIDQGHGEVIAILNRNNPVFYCVPSSTFEKMIELLDDLEIVQTVKIRANEPELKIHPNDL